MRTPDYIQATEKSIQDSLFVEMYTRGQTALFPNCTNGSMGEADLLAVSKARITTEYEIKISRNDFNADFKTKKLKHEFLRNGAFEVEYHSSVKGVQRCTTGCPNYFFFVVPEGLVKDVPDYAGLIYVTPKGGYQVDGWKRPFQLDFIKPAPKLHKYKLDAEELSKIYARHYLKYWRQRMKLTGGQVDLEN